MTGHQFYVVGHSFYKKRARGCKYLGQTPIYVMRDEPSYTMHRVPSEWTQEAIDKISKLEYHGIHESTGFPLFKEKE